MRWVLGVEGIFFEVEVYADREEGGSWLLEQEAYCWKWTLAHGR